MARVLKDKISDATALPVPQPFLWWITGARSVPAQEASRRFYFGWRKMGEAGRPNALPIVTYLKKITEMNK
jgi:hypothetical protein